MKELLLYEVDFQVAFDGAYQIVPFDTFDPGATVDGVICRRTYDAEGHSNGDQPSLLIRDRGDPNKEPACPRYAVVVRRMGRATPIPQSSGKFVGRFVTENGRWEWYVFGPRSSPPPYDGREPTPHPPPPPSEDDDPTGESPDLPAAFSRFGLSG